MHGGRSRFSRGPRTRHEIPSQSALTRQTAQAPFPKPPSTSSNHCHRGKHSRRTAGMSEFLRLKSYTVSESRFSTATLSNNSISTISAELLDQGRSVEVEQLVVQRSIGYRWGVRSRPPTFVFFSSPPGSDVILQKDELSLVCFLPTLIYFLGLVAGMARPSINELVAEPARVAK